MADNLSKIPVKGILKSSSSFDKNEPMKSGKEMKWDEMNILQTLHPPGKDYGHMKISEPKTPFSYYKDTDDGHENSEPRSDEETDSLDADLLAKKIQLSSTNLPKALIEEEDSEEDENETEEERAKRKVFEQKRKLHYNEFYAVKLARKLMEQEDDDDDDDDERKEEDTEEEEEEELAECCLEEPSTSTMPTTTQTESQCVCSSGGNPSSIIRQPQT